MQVRALTQPDTNEVSIGEAVIEALGWQDAQCAWFAVAWAKRSGLTLLEEPIRALRRRRRAVDALIGVDQHGATEEALHLALDLFTEARVYHDTAVWKTFHPKLYVVEAARRARIVTGSGNLTEGGLSFNYEVAVQLDLDLSAPSDAALLADFRSWFDLRWGNRDASRKLTAALIKKLMADPSIVVVPEAAVPSISRTRSSRSGGTRVFGPAVKGLRSRRSRLTGKFDADVSDAVTPVAVRPSQPNANRTTQNVTSVPRQSNLVLAAGLPKDRRGQAGFNAAVTIGFFGVSNNGDIFFAEAVDRQGTRYPMLPRSLVFPSGSNRNHRVELRDPEGRARAAGTWPIILVRSLGRRRFCYLYLYPGDSGYASVKREIAKRDGVGQSRKPETKRVYLTLAETTKVWPSCPL